MNTSALSGNVTEWQGDLLCFVIRGDEAWGASLGAVDEALGGLLSEAAQDEDFKGKPDSSFVLHTHGRIGASRVALLGAAADFSTSELRNYSAAGVKLGDKLNQSSVAVVVPAPGSDERADGVRYLAEGAVLGLYRFDRHRSEDKKAPSVESCAIAMESDEGIVNLSGDTMQAQIAIGNQVAQGISLARDLVNEGPNHMNPLTLADAAAAVAKEENLDCTIFGLKEIQDKNMELLLAVNAGSDIEPRLIHMTYTPEGDTTDLPVVAFVGKGLTFDAGGYNLKPTGAIDDMKIDMAGSAAVLGAMKGIRAIAPRAIVHAIIPSTENLVNGKAYKLGDVYTGQNGKTVEIRNTDAEGRLILADALCYAVDQGAQEIFSLATLTGACVVALGPYTCGVFGSQQTMVDDVLSAADDVGEDVWQLPLHAKLRRMLKSDVADMKNVGERWGGAITAALFLKEFVGDTDWVHIDLAGPAFLDSPVEAHMQKGGSGFGVLTLLEYVANK